MPTLDTAFAQKALQDTFGGLAPRTIITGNITVVADRNALYAQYDTWMIAHNFTNSAGQPWQNGDKRAADDAAGVRMNAFAEPAPSTDIYIDATQTDPTATVHEMLHVNTATGFIATVGRAINEGITQRLSIKAISGTGHALTGSEFTYVQEQRVVESLVGVVGEQVVHAAYFNGASTLVDTYNSLMGADTFALLEATVAPDTQAGYDAAVAMLIPPSLTQKVKAIDAVIDCTLSGGNLDIIESIISTCSMAERMQIYGMISPRVKDLTPERQTRLRQILLMSLPAVNDQPQGDTMIA